MGKILISLLIVGLFGVVSAGDCFGEDCEFGVKGDPEAQLELPDVIKIADQEFRRSLWYYLRKAVVTFQANIDVPDRFIHFFIYRNIVGTFLGISSWVKADQTAEINTFVRLGNGFSKDVETPYSPVNIQPFIISLRLAHGEYLIERDENGDYRINGKLIQFENEEDKVEEIDLDLKTQVVDEFIRKRYWYYLGGRDPAVLVHHETLQTTKRVYFVLTYINIVGTFLVISSCDEKDNVFINTFVRLGAGVKSTKDIE